MRIGILGRFIKMAHAIASVFDNRIKSAEGPISSDGAHKRRKGKLHFKQPKAFKARFLPSTGRSIRGPVFLPAKEDHHVSRQTCRARLRALFFGQFSVQFTTAPRRQRRRLARLAASLEYRRMMNDTTNRIPDDDPALAVA
jgi:hypothetical protein